MEHLPSHSIGPNSAVNVQCLSTHVLYNYGQVKYNRYVTVIILTEVHGCCGLLNATVYHGYITVMK